MTARPWHDGHWYGLLVATLVLPCALGSVAAYLALAAALLYLPLLGQPAARQTIINEPLFSYYAVALALLFVAFQVTAQGWRDAAAVVNFSVLMLAAPAYVEARRRAGRTALTGLAGFALAGAAVAVGVGGIEVFIFGEARAGMLAVNPIHYADVASALGWLALIGVFSARGGWRWLFTAGPLLGLAAARLADVRGALIAYPVLAAIAFLMLWRHVLTRRQALGALGGVAVVVALVLLSPGRLADLAAGIAQLFATGDTGNDSSDIRLMLWRAGAAAFAEAPIFGHGWPGLLATAEAFMTPEQREAVPDYHHLHSDLIDFAVGAGVLGLVAYVIFLVAPVAAALAGPADGLRPARIYGVSILAAGYAIFGLTNMLFGFEMQTNVYALAVALILGLAREDRVPRLDLK